MMNFAEIMTTIYEWLLQFVPVFRVVWVVAVALGAAMLVIAFVLKKNPARKKSPWVVGGIGLFLAVSSGAQLVMSLF